MKAILLDEAKKWLEENCENQYTRMAVFEIMQSMPAVDYQEMPNEPLTLEKLENMEDTTPVWWDQINSWVLVYKGNLTTWSGKHLYAKGSNGKFYRRPPEEVLKDG